MINRKQLKTIIHAKNVDALQLNSDEDIIEFYIETGGTSGGGCCEHQQTAYYQSDIDPNDMMVNFYLPLIKAIGYYLEKPITYKSIKLLVNMTTKRQYTKVEYYGNSVEYLIYSISIDDIEEAFS